ncbi:phenylacetate--CoA ligase family protein [Salinicoccus sp. CNSTN-B1]
MLKALMRISPRSIYYKSPVFMQHAMTSAYGYKLRKQRYNTSYREALAQYMRQDVSQAELLTQFLRHLKDNVPAYRDIEIDPDAIYDSFAALPFTTKQDMRYEMTERSQVAGNSGFSGTGGTTGESLMVHDSAHDRGRRIAYLDYIKIQNGVLPFSRRASFTGQDLTPVDHKNIIWRYNMPMNQMLYAASQLSPETIAEVYRSLKRFKPETMDGFPSGIHAVAKYILANGIDIDWEVTAIFPNAETLLPHIKADIEKAFHTTVIDQYASGEGAPFIYEEQDGGYVIGRETGLFEFFKIEGNLYEMVVTSYINHATPLVRYRINDNVEIDSERDYLDSYNDKINIRKIHGRKADYLIGSHGNRVSNVGIARAVEGLEDKVISYQFIQEDLKNFIINMVIEPDFTKQDETVFKNRIIRRLGKDSRYRINYVDFIPREKSGKLRFLINEVTARQQ